ncbi:unnamed protein product [Rhizophagus irregularis]|nr:unnamed protein product [Rhizophagus irregularis]
MNQDSLRVGFRPSGKEEPRFISFRWASDLREKMNQDSLRVGFRPSEKEEPRFVSTNLGSGGLPKNENPKIRSGGLLKNENPKIRSGGLPKNENPKIKIRKYESLYIFTSRTSPNRTKIRCPNFG